MCKLLAASEKALITPNQNGTHIELDTNAVGTTLATDTSDDAVDKDLIISVLAANLDVISTIAQESVTAVSSTSTTEESNRSKIILKSGLRNLADQMVKLKKSKADSNLDQGEISVMATVLAQSGREAVENIASLPDTDFTDLDQTKSGASSRSGRKCEHDCGHRHLFGRLRQQ